MKSNSAQHLDRIKLQIVIEGQGSLPCQNYPEAFHHDNSAIQNEAKTLCIPCPIKEECLAYALKHEDYGVWGGTSWRDRRRSNRLVKLSQPISPKLH